MDSVIAQIFLLAGLISIALSIPGMSTRPASVGTKAQFIFGLVLVLIFVLAYTNVINI